MTTEVLSALFRQEALDAQKTQLLGSIVLLRPLSFAIVCIATSVLALGVAALLIFGEYTKRARVLGVLVPENGVIKVMPPQSGLIVVKYVVEGQRVSEGDRLFKVSLERNTDSGLGPASNSRLTQLSQSGSASVPVSVALLQTVEARRSSLKRERINQQTLTTQQRQQLSQSIESGVIELVQLQREIATQTARLTSVENQTAKFVGLAEQKFISDLSLQQKRDEVLDQQSRLQQLERAYTDRSRTQSNLRSELEQLRTKAERELAQIDPGLLELEQTSITTEAQREFIITAPQGGVITGIQAAVGQMTSGQPLLAILPEGTLLRAHLFAPSNSIGFVEIGQSVRLRYAAYPHQKFGQYLGRVIGVSKVPFGAQELPANLGQGVMIAAQSGEGLYRITVQLDQQTVLTYGKTQALSPGMQLEADVMQDTRRLIEWLFEPIFSIKGRA